MTDGSGDLSIKGLSNPLFIPYCKVGQQACPLP